MFLLVTFGVFLSIFVPKITCAGHFFKAMEEAVSYQCSCCSFRCFSWREFYRHQFLTHSNEFNFMMNCFVEGCSQTFRCNSTFVSHLFRKHRGVDLESEAKKSHGSCSRAARLEYQTIGLLEDSVIVDAQEETCNMGCKQCC